MLDIKISERIGNDIVIVLDSTGIKVTNRGEWLPPHKMECEKRVSQDTYSNCRYQEKRKLYHLKSQVKKYMMMVAGSRT